MDLIGNQQCVGELLYIADTSLQPHIAYGSFQIDFLKVLINEIIEIKYGIS